MQYIKQRERKYVFVCGLQRSGTSVLARNIGRMEDCTAFKNTGVLQDEGQYLQDIYPRDREFGGTGRYGFDPRAHLTESSPLLTPENISNLQRSWHSHWDKDKTICLEKTPGNLIMTRFLQAAFPNAYFVVVKRHPVAVSLATQRWKVSLTALHSLFEHWLRCYDLFEEDRKHLRRVYELRYEDYIQGPAQYHHDIAAFIGSRVPEPPKEDQFRKVTQWPPVELRVPERTMEALSGTHNQKYFDRWSELLNRSPFKRYYQFIATKYEPQVARHGYSLVRGFGAPGTQRAVSRLAGHLYCFGADFAAMCCRASIRAKPRVRVAAKAILPEFVAERVRESRRKSEASSSRNSDNLSRVEPAR
jgi:Sulfotransferase family